MAPTYKLTYFGIMARGEPIRFLLIYGGLEFEDIRVERADWPELKPHVPFGQLPILEIDGKVAHQSFAINRYLAKQVKLAGKDDWEDLEIDSIVDTMSDLRSQIVVFMKEDNETRKKCLKTTLINETIPYFMSRLDAIAEKNNGYLALGRLTWADLYFAGQNDTMNSFMGTDIVTSYPNLKTVENNVFSIPSIKAWIEKRPKSDY